jgi:hypothetical protein
MRGPVGARALPETLREWNYVNTRVPAWGVRHYRRDGAENDPSSPFLEQATANIPDKGALGITFWIEPVNRTATVNYLSTNSEARQILSAHLGMADLATAFPREIHVRLRQSAPDM